MKIFIYKTLFVIFCVYVLFEFTLGYKIKTIESKINNLYSKENLLLFKEKIREEMSSAIDKDVYLDPKDAKIIGKFIQKIQQELNAVKSE